MSIWKSTSGRKLYFKEVLPGSRLTKVGRLFFAQEYGVTYPTIRAHLDAVIKKIELGEQAEEDSYVKLIKRMAVEGNLEFDAAAVLIREYKNRRE